MYQVIEQEISSNPSAVDCKETLLEAVKAADALLKTHTSKKSWYVPGCSLDVWIEKDGVQIGNKRTVTTGEQK